MKIELNEIIEIIDDYDNSIEEKLEESKKMNDEELIAKFMANAGSGFSKKRLAQILSQTLALETVADIGEYMHSLTYE